MDYLLRRHERRQHSRFRLVERRSGFDRRAERNGALLGPTLLALRDSPAVLLALLLAANVMNVLDFLLTLSALEAGYAEGNPLLASIITTRPALAAALKILCIGVVSLVVWRLRRHRLVLEVALLMFAAFAAVLLWHAYGHAVYY